MGDRHTFLLDPQHWMGRDGHRTDFAFLFIEVPYPGEVPLRILSAKRGANQARTCQQQTVLHGSGYEYTGKPYTVRKRPSVWNEGLIELAPAVQHKGQEEVIEQCISESVDSSC